MVISGRAWFTPGVPGIYVVLLCDVLTELGHDPAPLLRGLGFDRQGLLDPECRLPLDQANATAEAALARNLAVEWGPRNIRVNAIAPGLVRTDFAKALTEDPERRKRAEERTPVRRIGEPVDIAGVTLFLASDASAYVTGQTLVADGGETIC